jgi:hypothetical protein
MNSIANAVRRSSDRGVALVITLLALGVLAALSAGLLLTTSVERLTAGNHADAVTSIYAADAGLELAVRELAQIDDWNRVLSGNERSRFTDGAPPGPRTLPGGGMVNLTTLTNELTCGRATGCTDARIRATTAERPWGANNPRWQLFLFAPLRAIGNPSRLPGLVYVVVWLGDDAAEEDDDAETDGGGELGEGRHAVRARVEAFGPGPTRRSLEARLVRPCHDREGEIVCGPGIRVQSWRVAAATLP